MTRLSIPKSRSKKPLLAGVGVLLFIAVGALGLHSAYAAGPAGWNAGRIIDDSVFTDTTTMSASDIQRFLERRVSSCDTQGTQPSEYGGGTRAQWGTARGYPPPYTCLKNYTQGGKKASQIIYNVAQQFNINPQVLLVVLQKEQGLVTDTWPLSLQYKTATGYGCPDNAACDSDYFGFTNQVTWTGRMFRAIMNDSPTWYTPYVLGNNFIQYNPSSSCGGSTVNIQNRATKALYNYTPYQPNQGALNAGWGTASCGSYGNRNFYLYFTQWFGSTHQQFKSLSPQRWMQIATDTTKIDLWTGENVGDTLVSGQQLRFVDKILLDGQWYLRTESDKANNRHTGVPIDDVDDIPYTAMTTPRWFNLAKDAHKRDPSAESNASGLLDENSRIFFASKIVINGITYFRTNVDTTRDNNKAISAVNLEEVPYNNFATSRWMQVKRDTHKVDARTGTQDSATITQGTKIKFDSKILTDAWYFRTQSDTSSAASLAIPAADIEEIPYTTFRNGDYCLQLSANASKVQPSSGEAAPGEAVKQGQQVCVAKQITINGAIYYQTTHDARLKINLGLPATAFEEIPYLSFASPRWMKLTVATAKQNPKSGETVGSSLAKGQRLHFSSKIYVKGKWYYRTDTDTDADIDATLKPENLIND